MFKHALLIALRHSWRNKHSFFINLISLSVGLAGVLFIFLWVNDEWQMDKFHANDDRLFQVMFKWDYGDRVSVGDFTFGPLATTLQEEIPEVESATNIVHWFTDFPLSVGENSFSYKGHYVGAAFFNVFDFKLLRGESDKVLENINSIVISERVAVELFGSIEQAVGNTIQSQQGDNLMVSGVFANVPKRSTLQFDVLLPFQNFLQRAGDAHAGWENTGPYTMLTLKEGVDKELLTSKINAVIHRHYEDEEQVLSPFLRKFSDAYLYGIYENGEQAGGRIEYVWLFSIIGIFILLLACINFMNLATARSFERTKEVGVKKTFGIRKGKLVTQYLLESTVFAFLALFVAITIVQLFLPGFNDLTEKSLSLQLSWQSIAALGGLTLLTGLLAGSYPAFYLSSFQPLQVLKNVLPTGGGVNWIRKSLIVFQFSLSVVLAIAVLVVYQQIRFAQTQHLGYDKNNLVQFILDIENREQIATFVTEAQRLPAIENISSGNIPVDLQNRTTGVEWAGKNADEYTTFYLYNAHYDMFETMGMRMKAGRTFSREFGNERAKAIVNETAIAAMGLDNPIGKTISLWESVPLEIIGVVEDFHFQSFHEAIQPLIFRFMPNASPMLIAKLKAGKESEALAGLQSLYNQFNPGVPFAYEFIDQQYDQLYTAEQRVSVLAQIFAGFALFISCLGLFGLTLFTAYKRKKEIGIRKVLGASVAHIVAIISADFVRLIIIATIIAFPIAWWGMNAWLAGFAYRIEIQWWMFAVAGVAAIGIALLTVSFQAVRAAVANPVESLRSE